jgi:type VI protein secretion system component VasK
MFHNLHKFLTDNSSESILWKGVIGMVGWIYAQAGELIDSHWFDSVMGILTQIGAVLMSCAVFIAVIFNIAKTRAEIRNANAQANRDQVDWEQQHVPEKSENVMQIPEPEPDNKNQP